MSSQIPGHPPGPQGFKQILDRALEEYNNITGTDLVRDPLASKLSGCDSVDAVIGVYEDQLHEFKHFRRPAGKKGKVIAVLKPVVEVILALSTGGVLGDALGSAFRPAKAVLGGIGILLQAAKKVSASYDALVGLFESISNFLERLKIYTDGAHGLAPRMSAILVKITAPMLSVFALATQQIRQGRLKKSGKTLLGQDTEIDEAVKTLDKLTAEEQRVVAALTLWTVQGLAADMNRQRLREWLSPPNSSVDHNDTRSRHYKGTSTWLVNSKDFLEWKELGSLLWISGKPGAGKTFLCSTVIEDLRNPPANPDVWTITTAYFYCTFRHSEKQTIRGLLRSILDQLSTRSNTYYLVLSHLFSKEYFNDPERKPSDEHLIECLKEMLEYSDGMTYIVVDALDECPNSGTTSQRRAILKYLEQLAGLKLPAVRLCVTSRPEDDIGSALRPLSSHHVALEMSRDQDGDILQYILSIIESHEKMRAWPAKIKEKVINTLSGNAEGMFRYASCQLDELCDCDAANIETTLEALPKTLQETYEVTLERIEDGKWQSAHRLFQCLSFSTRPLRVKELADVLAIDFRPDIPEYNEDWRAEDPEKAILSVCPGSFITIVEGEMDWEEAKVVQFVHFSVKEFLVSYISSAQGNPRVVRFHVIPEPSHVTLARACLAILFLIGDQPEEGSMEESPLAKYAAEYWADHARFEDVSLSIMASLLHFFQISGPYLSTWTRLLHDHPNTEIILSIDHSSQSSSLPSNAPLYCAALCGIRHAVRVLCTSNPECANEIGGPCGAPLHAASITGHVETAKLLLDLGADVNRQGGRYGTALEAASCWGQIDTMRLLLEWGADVNAQGGNHGTALQVAATGKPLDITRLLLEHGADVNAQGGRYGTALQAATFTNSLDITRLLLEHGADVDARGGEYGTALQAATFQGSLAIIQLLLERGADVNAKGGEYGTALQAAVFTKSPYIMRLLLEHGADVNAQGGRYGTALQAAALHYSLEIVMLLLERGADVKAQGGTYGTALQAAAFEGSLSITRLLLERGANVNVQGGKCGSALQAAASGGSLNIARLLLEHGADVNVQGGEYGTALQAAAAYPHARAIDIVRLLLKHGADPNIQGGEYGSALQAALSKGNTEIAQLLSRITVTDRANTVHAQIDSDDRSPWLTAGAEG